MAKANQQFEHGFTKRISVQADPDVAWNELEEALQNSQKDFVTEKLSNIDLKVEETEDGYDLAANLGGVLVPFRDRGLSAFYEQLKINRLMGDLDVLSNKERAQEVRKLILEDVLEDKKNSYLRFHTADFQGQKQVVHVASPKNNTVSEVELFRAIREAASLYNFLPVRADADIDGVTVQVIEVDRTFELEPTGQDAHRFVSSQVDKFMGMLTITLSELEKANTVDLGIYREICFNTAIVGAENELSMRAIKNAKLQFGTFLKAMFEAAAKSSLNFKDRVQNLQNIPFGEMARRLVETTISDANVIRPYNEHIKDDINNLIEIPNTTMFDAWNILTERAQDKRIAPRNQLRLQKVAGDLVIAAK